MNVEMLFRIFIILFFAISRACDDDLQCSLNGLCINAMCKCDDPWTGSACEVMQLKPALPTPAYGTFPRISTWGGGVVFDGQRHHLFVSRSPNGCPLKYWRTNTQIDHAISNNGPEGPYIFADVAIPNWATNPAPVVLHDGTYAIFQIGSSTPQKASNCSHNVDPPPMDRTIHISKSLNGPWTPLPNTLGDCNNPAPWVHSNGTIFIGCGGILKRAHNITGPFDDVSRFPMTGGPEGAYEDPQLYIDHRGNFHGLYHVYKFGDPRNCANETVSAHAFSKDGFAWNISKTQPYGTQVELTSGKIVTVATRERPKLIFNSGKMTHLINGVSGVPNCLDSKTGCVDCKYNHWDYTLIQAFDI